MTDDKLIHIRFEYPEAVQSKKDILSLEMEMLKTAGIIKRFGFLRAEELKAKVKIYTKIKELLAEMKRLEKSLPNVKVPKKFHRESLVKISEGKKPAREDITSQLWEIQKKLDSLETNNF